VSVIVSTRQFNQMCQHNLITYSIICRFPGKRDWHWIEARGIGFETCFRLYKVFRYLLEGA